MLQSLPALPAMPALANSLHELPFGSQTQLQTADGRIAAFLAFLSYEKGIGTAKYALRVLNNSGNPVRARVFVEAGGLLQSAYPRDFEVAPHSMRDDVVPVRVDVTGPYDRAIVEVTSDDGYFTVEAPPPPRERVRWLPWAALALVPLLGGATTQMLAPRVLQIGAPPKALAGSTIHIPYQTSGVGSVEYDVTRRDGVQLAAGIGPSAGVVPVAIPASAEGAPYTVHVRLKNAFTGAEASAVIAAIVPKIVHAATPAPSAESASLISDLSVSPSPVQAGDPLTVRYATQGRAGDIWLVDTSGRTWAHEPISPAGTSRIHVPRAAAGRDLRVVLHVTRDKQHAENSVMTSVLPSDAVQSGPDAVPAPTAAPIVPTVTLSSQVVSPGDPVTVRVAGVKGDVRITVMSAAGETLEQGDADQGNPQVSITAPNVTGVTTFYVVATLTNGVAQQSIVRRLVVTPR